MVTDQQVRRLFQMSEDSKLNKSQAAIKSGMDEKTARKYLSSGKLPSDLKADRSWRTHNDAFSPVWDEIRDKLEVNPGLEAKTLFEFLQREYPGQFQDGQLRTLQRHIKRWRATEGPPKEVFFPQEHHPGILSQSDFTHMSSLEITIKGLPFDHLLYHFVLTYSNWETGSICFSESFESLSEGLQNALWTLGGVPVTHQTDRLSAAVQNTTDERGFTPRYQGLLRHYGLKGQKIQPRKANENGDVEQSHHRFKRAVDQSLMIRGSRDFESRSDYESFLEKMFTQRNRGRQLRFEKDRAVLKALPLRRLDSVKHLKVRVTRNSTIRVNHNTYSVSSRLINEHVDARLYMDHVEVWYAGSKVESMPRLRGEDRHHINYRHIIDWLVRKPGAFANYCYRDDLFPSTNFRLAYDLLKRSGSVRYEKQYLKILYLASKEGESRVEAAILHLLEEEQRISFEAIEALVASELPEEIYNRVREIIIAPVNIEQYDQLIAEGWSK